MAPDSGDTPLFSLFLPQMRMSFPTILEKVAVAERVGFDGISLMDHLAPPGVPGTAMYDGFVTAAAIATHTERIRIAHLVLCASFRHPAVLAKEAISLDHLSNGRFDLGIGWGSVPDELARFDLNDEPPVVLFSHIRDVDEENQTGRRHAIEDKVAMHEPHEGARIEFIARQAAADPALPPMADRLDHRR